MKRDIWASWYCDKSKFVKSVMIPVDNIQELIGYEDNNEAYKVKVIGHNKPVGVLVMELVKILFPRSIPEGIDVVEGFKTLLYYDFIPASEYLHKECLAGRVTDEQFCACMAAVWRQGKMEG